MTSMSCESSQTDHNKIEVVELFWARQKGLLAQRYIIFLTVAEHEMSNTLSRLGKSEASDELPSGKYS